MNDYSWTSAYVAAIEEHNREKLQVRIGVARQAITERFAALITGSMANGEREEFRRLCDARRALDLLQRFSNDGDVSPAEQQRKSA